MTESLFGSQTTPPLPPPSGTSTTAVFHVIHAASARTAGLDPARLTYSVQGFGNAGSHACRILANEVGAKVVAVGELDGTVWNPDGLDIAKLTAHFAKHKGVKGFPEAEYLPTSKDALEVPCDCLLYTSDAADD